MRQPELPPPFDVNLVGKQLEVCWQYMKDGKTVKIWASGRRALPQGAAAAKRDASYPRTGGRMTIRPQTILSDLTKCFTRRYATSTSCGHAHVVFIHQRPLFTISAHSGRVSDVDFLRPDVMTRENGDTSQRRKPQGSILIKT